MRICLEKNSVLPKHKIRFCDKTSDFTDCYHVRAAKKGFCSTLAYIRVSSVCEAELCFTDEEETAELNLRFRNRDSATDVLSFPALEIKKGEKPRDAAGAGDYINGRIFLGSVIICKAIAIKQAAQYGHSPEREFAFLAVHSALHLLGYDHVDDKDGEVEMLTLQEQILSRAGFQRQSFYKSER